MPNKLKILAPLKTVRPFSMKLSTNLKKDIYGFGTLSSLVPKPSSTSPGIGPVFGRVPNFGRLGFLVKGSYPFKSLGSSSGVLFRSRG